MIVKSPLAHDFTGSAEPHPLSDGEHRSEKQVHSNIGRLILTVWWISLITQAGDGATLDCLASFGWFRVVWLDLVHNTALSAPKSKEENDSCYSLPTY